ncbi:11655_t:CDS:10 [Ambispora gerdemannii]|uniref:11655_t:CDS:1 n=1 Tax=Ambispora gerdemannii TaxID=144530 RepID=A0A9N8Z2H6_9GLOM|nr:11655_t:CDS:10 [Ambispora gerdemannii]
MRIEELIIEGFKSYSVRTHITGWDAEFNAITGLNGSGKSNVLDAICFVLGITNLSQVRANNMQDLIYKRGQAGVTKATVTIVFNNEDRENSPVGFEQYKQIIVTRQIVMGGQSKYIVNGHKAQQQAVANLFQSVQLNINNPHFLIMQGKITKVLNMKPPEILAMIEEAAGTRMFEERKEKALKTIAKKEKKVEEITTLLNEKIGPMLEKLRTEKRSYLEFVKTKSEIERLSRLVIAYEYHRYEDKLHRSGADFEAKKEKIRDMEELVENLKEEIAHIENEVRRLMTKKEKEFGNSGNFQELEKKVKEYSNHVVRIKTKCDLKAASIEEENKKKESLLAAKTETELALVRKTGEHEKLQTQFNEVKRTFEEKNEQVRKSEELLQTLSTGISAQEGHENGYMEQIQKAKNNATQASTEVEQAKLKISHLKKELNEKEPQVKKSQKDSKELMGELRTAQKAVQDLQATLSRMNWDPQKETDLLNSKSSEQEIVRKLSERFESLSSQLSSLEFTYSDPVPNFDRSKVKGLVAELVTIDRETYSTALEICAGGRLYNVVVENETVGSQLLEKGKLRKRVTIIPLNKVQAFKLSAEKIKTAEGIAPGKVNLALRLIGYDREVSNAMEYVFGSTLICDDANSAKRVTFDKNIKAKSVTLDGDVYDPSGTLQGGSKPSTAGILIKLQNLKEVKKELNSHKQKLANLVTEWEGMQKTMQQYQTVKQKLDLKKHEAALIEEQITKSSNAQAFHEIENIKLQISEQENIVVAANTKRKAALESCGQIEKEMNEFKNNRDSKLKDIQQSVTNGKTELAKSSQTVKNMQRAVQTFHLEIKQLAEDLENNKKEISISDSHLEQLSAEAENMKQEISKFEGCLNEAQAALQKEREKLTAFDEEIKELQAAQKNKTSQMTETQLEMSKINHEVERFFKEKQVAEQAVQRMEAEHEWILDQKHLFGESNTPYDFFRQNPNDGKKMLRQLEEKHNNMRKMINEKVMLIIERDFGTIFSDLLPGSFAKLQPPEGKSLLEGLEVKVCLGGIWKQSLAELSGGQRSLIALSLILSLLQFKPAPMYILDEVDAALDLSHTQNIGQLLRTRFKGSQFIIVSLKDGMFNNANVLFRTRFRDGTSIIERTSQKQEHNKENIPASSASNNNGSNNNKGKGKI